MITVNKFAETIKAKYPQYRDVDNLDLTRSMVEKYPEYKEQVAIPKTSQELQEEIEIEKRREYKNLPETVKMLEGASENIWSTVKGVGSLFGVGDKQKMKQDSDEFKSFTKGDVSTGAGSLASDLAMLITPGGMAKTGATSLLKVGSKWAPRLVGGLAEGAVSATAHQAQNLGRGEDASLMGAGLEVGLSGAVPLVGGTMADVLKRKGISQLPQALKPKDKIRKSFNPPDYEYALKEGLTSPFGGAQKIMEKAESKIDKIWEIKDELAKKADARIPLANVILNTRKELQKKIGDGPTGILQSEYDNALKYELDAWNTAKTKGAVKGIMPADIATSVRQTAGSKGNFIKDGKLSDESLYYRVFTQELEKMIDNKVVKSGFGSLTPMERSIYSKAKKDLSKLVPLKKVAEDAKNRTANNFKPGLLDYSAMGLGAVGGLASDKDNTPTQNIVTGMLGALALKRLGTTAGGADMLYNTGRAMGGLPSAVETGMGQLLRSGANEYQK
jgi:hypothetical protein